MTIDPSLRRIDYGSPTDDSTGPITALICAECHTAEYLIIESIHQHRPKVPGLVEVEYSCGRCESYSAHTSSVQNVATILNNSPASLSVSGVLKFGDHYIHCGEPMEFAHFQSLPPGTPNRSLGAEIPLAPLFPVLRCLCGFQIECAPPRED